MTLKEWLHFIAQESMPAIAIRRFLCYAPVFKGRATRIELVATYGIVLTCVAIVAVVFPQAEVGVLSTLNRIWLAILVLMPLASATLRRLHDIGHNAWMLMLIFIPYAGPVILLVNLLGSGQQFDNEHGPNPYA